MYHLILLFFYLSLFNLPVNNGENDDNCLTGKNYYSNHLATKTAYRFIANNNDLPLRYEGCVAKKIWMVIRHGSRYPGRKVIRKIRGAMLELRDRIIQNHVENNGELCPGTLSNLTLWSPQVELSDHKHLVHEGEDEMIELAERFQNRFPEILSENYSNSTYKFHSTATQRTKESRRYFTVGLFGRKVSRYVWTPEPVPKDPILRFYKLCTKWIRDVDKNPDSLAERVKFEESNYMKSVINNVSRRLGFNNDLSLDDVKLIYVTCAFESAWSPYHSSPWCGLFTKDELEVMEYAEDLEYYWIDGYGHRINYEQACPILGDMLNHLMDEKGPTSTFYFTHSGTILKLLAHIGLYKDEHELTHGTFPKKRMWRVGVIDSFASNLAFLLFKCGDGMKVLSLHQEREVTLPGCGDELCPLDTLVRNYRDSLFSCRFSEMCEIAQLRIQRYANPASDMTKEGSNRSSSGSHQTSDFKASSSFVVRSDPVRQCAKLERVPTGGASGSGSVYLEKVELSAAAEERRRTGRYLAVCLTLVMVFIASYHILMRQMPVLVGLLAPAIIMILYLIWLLYFAKKRKRAEITLV